MNITQLRNQIVGEFGKRIHLSRKGHGNPTQNMIRMSFIFRTCNPLQIFNSIIKDVAIFMVCFWSFWINALKRNQDKPCNVKCFSWVAAKINFKIAPFSCSEWLKRSKPSKFMTGYVSKIAGTVCTFVARNWHPRFFHPAIVIVLMGTVNGFSANPAFTDFNANQFGTSGNKVVIKDNAWLTNGLFYGAVRVTNTAVANSFVDIGTNGWLRIISNNANAFMVGPNGIGMTNLGNLYIGGNSLFTGTLTGNGSGLTNLNASNLASGTASQAVLPTATTNFGLVVMTNAAFANAVPTATTATTGKWTTDGSGLTNLNSDNIAQTVLTNNDTRIWTNKARYIMLDSGTSKTITLVPTNGAIAGQNHLAIGTSVNGLNNVLALSYNVGDAWTGGNVYLMIDGNANFGSGQKIYFSDSTVGNLTAGTATNASISRPSAGTLTLKSNVLIHGSATITNGLQLAYSNSPIKFINVGATNAWSASATTAYIVAGTNGGGGTANSAEIYTLDGAGNYTLISPHAADAPAGLDDNSGAALDYIVRHHNVYLGAAEWINISRLARRTEQIENVLQIIIQQTSTNGLTALQIGRLNQFASLTPAEKNIVAVRTNFATAQSWSVVQNAERATYSAGFTNALTAYNAAVAAGDTNAVAPSWSPPPLYPVPPRLQARGVQ